MNINYLSLAIQEVHPVGQGEQVEVDSSKKYPGRQTKHVNES